MKSSSATASLAGNASSGPSATLPVVMRTRDMFPAAIVTPILIPYGTDSNSYRPKGVKSYGFFPALLPAEALSSMHGDAEFIPLDQLGRASRLLFEALRDTAR